MLKKNKYPKFLFGKYGKVVEEDDKIIVYISQGKVYKNKYGIFVCEGINDSLDEELLDKTIYYVFDNIYFDGNTTIYGKNANHIFKECKFNGYLEIKDSDSITMENNKYMFFSFNNNYIELNANNITIKNNDFINASFAKKYDEPKVNIFLLGNKVNIEKSNICTEYAGNINIMSQKLLINNSTINGPNVYINADNILTKKSIIVSSSTIEIKNKNCDFRSAVRAPKVIYNGVKLNSQSEILEIDKQKSELLKARMELINKLHTIKDRCLEENRQTVIEVEERLNNKKICKILKIDK